MELDWTTFALEILNFLVLVWLLKRFFYRPVLAVIEERRAQTAKTMADAAAVRSEAQSLKGEYQTHLAELEKERAAARSKLDAEIAAERGARLGALATEIAEERRRREGLEAREKDAVELVLERQALATAARFATRLLERLAGPELEAKLVAVALAELESQPPERLEALRGALREPEAQIKIASAYALDAAQRAAFSRALARLAGRELVPEFAADPELKAGVRILAGSWVLMASLRDELEYFAASFEHGG